jgi:hypothetical protein
MRAQHWQLFMGAEYAGFKVYHYAAGSTTPKNVWADPWRSAPQPNPVLADSNGWIAFYADGDYRIEITTSDDILLQVFDPIRITSDQGTEYETYNGVDLPAAETFGAWTLFAQHDNTDFQQFWLTTGTRWVAVSPNLGGAVFNVLNYGAVGDGIADDVGAIQDTLDAAAAVDGLILLPGVSEHYRVSDTLLQSGNTTALWVGSYVKIASGTLGTTRGGVWNMRATGVESTNITVINPLIDANASPNNCIGAGSGLEIIAGGIGASVSNVRVIGGHVTGATMDQTIGGGKGITFQRGIWNVSVTGTTITNCGQAINTAAFYRNEQTTNQLPPPTIEYAKNILFNGIVVENCGRLYQHDDLVSGGTSGSDNTTCQVTLGNISARNCGDPRLYYNWTGQFGSSKPIDASGGGIFVFHGGTRITMRNINCVNPPGETVVPLDSVFRGQFKYCEFSDIFVEGSFRTILNGNSPDASVMQATPDFWPLTNNTLSNIRVVGSIDYVIDSEPVANGTLRLRYNWFDITCDTPNDGILTDDAISAVNNYLVVRDITTNAVREGITNLFGDLSMNTFTEGDDVMMAATSFRWGNMRMTDGAAHIALVGDQKQLRLGYRDEDQLVTDRVTVTTIDVAMGGPLRLLSVTNAEEALLSGNSEVNPGSIVFNTDLGTARLWNGTVWSSL